MNWKYWVTGALLAIGLLCTWPMARSVSPTVTTAKDSKLSILLVGLGGTRGILSELLWWRINDLQRQSRFAEIYPLTQLLTELSPESPKIAAFNAWNCSYNIALSYNDFDQRWEWMKRGYKILSESVQQHPNDRNLHREIASFWQLKFYGEIDIYQDEFHAHAHEIPLLPEEQAFATAEGFPESFHTIPAVRLYYWAHRFDSIRDEAFAIRCLLETFPDSTIPHKAFANVITRACRDDLLMARDLSLYKDIARDRLQRFPNDPDLQAVLFATP